MPSVMTPALASAAANKAAPPASVSANLRNPKDLQPAFEQLLKEFGFTITTKQVEESVEQIKNWHQQNQQQPPRQQHQQQQHRQPPRQQQQLQFQQQLQLQFQQQQQLQQQQLQQQQLQQQLYYHQLPQHFVALGSNEGAQMFHSLQRGPQQHRDWDVRSNISRGSVGSRGSVSSAANLAMGDYDAIKALLPGLEKQGIQFTMPMLGGFLSKFANENKFTHIHDCHKCNACKDLYAKHNSRFVCTDGKTAIITSTDDNLLALLKDRVVQYKANRDAKNLAIRRGGRGRGKGRCEGKGEGKGKGT